MLLISCNDSNTSNCVCVIVTVILLPSRRPADSDGNNADTELCTSHPDFLTAQNYHYRLQVSGSPFDILECSEELLRQLSSAIKNQLRHLKTPN